MCATSPPVDPLVARFLQLALQVARLPDAARDGEAFGRAVGEEQ